MGAADLIPGVSGGTVALITGIYRRLIDAIAALNIDNLKCLLRGEFRCFWNNIDGNFLASLAMGILTSVFAFSHLIAYLLKNYPVPLWSFFFGLILASIYFVLKQAGKIRPLWWLFFLSGAIVAYWITSISPEQGHESLIFIFLSGAVASMAMILPGISGSYILVILGMYAFILSSVNEMRIFVLTVFTLGVLTGLLGFSRILKWLFNRFPGQTLVFLAGFLLGSLNKVWPWKNVLRSEMVNGKEIILEAKNVLPGNFSGDPAVLTALTAALTGFVLVILLEKQSVKNG